MNTSLEMFLFGLGGSTAIEIVRAWRFYTRNHRLPADYSKKGFWVVRMLLALASAILPVAYGVQSEILAMNLGATGLFVYEEMARNPPYSSEQAVAKRQTKRTA